MDDKYPSAIYSMLFYELFAYCVVVGTGAEVGCEDESYSIHTRVEPVVRILWLMGSATWRSGWIYMLQFRSFGHALFLENCGKVR